MKGFTLVEMMVVLIIIVVITMVAVTGQTTFNRSLLLTDTAYTIAFSIREAQTLGLSSRVASGVYNAGYGIRFSTANPSSYLLYADTAPAAPGNSRGGVCDGHTEPSSSPDSHPGDCMYDATATPAELIRTYTLNRGFTVYRFCGTLVEDGEDICSGLTFETLDITFMRPSTNATLIAHVAGALPVALSDATIYLRSPDGGGENIAERCITVSTVGQIAVGSCDE